MLLSCRPLYVTDTDAVYLDSTGGAYRNARTISISQEDFIGSILARFNLPAQLPSRLPFLLYIFRL
jgi:hypothetical protein